MDSRQVLNWLDAHYQAMPPAAALALQPAYMEDGALHLQAGLAANINDKGCAFGGSLASLMTLAGWGLVNARLRLAGLDMEVFVADSQVRYLKPVFSDLRARAQLVDGGTWDAFIDRLRTRARAAVGVTAQIGLACGSTACRAQLRYVAVAKR